MTKDKQAKDKINYHNDNSHLRNDTVLLSLDLPHLPNLSIFFHLHQLPWLISLTPPILLNLSLHSPIHRQTHTLQTSIELAFPAIPKFLAAPPAHMALLRLPNLQLL